MRILERARPEKLAERRGRVGDIVAERLDLTARPQELPIARVFLQRAVQVARIREHRGETPVRREVHRIDPDRGPQERERGDPVPRAQQLT